VPCAGKKCRAPVKSAEQKCRTKSFVANCKFVLSSRGNRLTHSEVQLAMVNSTTKSTTEATKFGFTEFAETLNGRLAMLGFAIGLATELLTGHGILAQLGLM
jgi:hypothetical protein